MGYRSDVGYKIEFHDKETMALFLAEVKSKDEYKLALEEKRVDGGRDGLEINEERMYISFFATDVKWYSEYADVQSHEAILDLAIEYRDEHEKQIEYAFARTGEEIGDNESYASADGYDLVWVSRQIIFDED
jgi:dsDNA-binding SOS-regulon protein